PTSVPSARRLPQLQSQPGAAVRLLGFAPAQDTPDAPRLPVTLAELKYRSPKEGVYVTEADVAAVMQAEVQNSGRRYTGRYTATLNQRFGMAPNQETRSEEHTSELQSRENLVCRLLLEKKKAQTK